MISPVHKGSYRFKAVRINRFVRAGAWFRIAGAAGVILLCLGATQKKGAQVLMELAKRSRVSKVSLIPPIPPTNRITRSRALLLPPRPAITNITLAYELSMQSEPSWGWVGGTMITNQNGSQSWVTNGAIWTGVVLTMNSNFITGLIASTNLGKTWFPLTNGPYARSNRFMRSMTNDSEVIRAFYGPAKQ